MSPCSPPSLVTLLPGNTVAGTSSSGPTWGSPDCRQISKTAVQVTRLWRITSWAIPLPSACWDSPLVQCMAGCDAQSPSGDRAMGQLWMRWGQQFPEGGALVPPLTLARGSALHVELGASS